MTALWEQFAAGIRAALERQQIRQHDLALALGVSDKHISRLLTGHGTPSWEMLDRITEQLGIVWTVSTEPWAVAARLASTAMAP